MTNYIMCFGACLATMYYSEYGLRHVFYLDRHNLELIARTAKAEVRQSRMLSTMQLTVLLWTAARISAAKAADCRHAG